MGGAGGGGGAFSNRGEQSVHTGGEGRDGLCDLVLTDQDRLP